MERPTGDRELGEQLHLLAGLPYDEKADWEPALRGLTARFTCYAAALHLFAEARCERTRFVTFAGHKPVRPLCPDDPDRQRWCAPCLARDTLSPSVES
jgi:hypothetical protein